jgi:hypothetical protein
MEIKAKPIMTGVYIALVLGCSISLAPSTINYLHFYRAIEKLNISVSGFQWQLKNNYLMISGDLAISNAEDYSGLKIRVVHYNFWYVNSSDYMSKYYGLGSSFWSGQGPEGTEIEPNANITVPLDPNVHSRPLNTYELETLQKLQQEGQLVWMIDGSAWIWTLLGEPLQIFFPQSIIE